MDRLDGGHVSIGNAKRFVGRGELDALADGEVAFDLLVDAYAREAARIVGGTHRSAPGPARRRNMTARRNNSIAFA
jgi:hypothetical protein